MAFTPIDSVSNGSTGSGNVTSPNIDSTGATLLIVTVVHFTGVDPPTFSDSKGNRYKSATSYSHGNVACTTLWCLNPTSVGAGHNVSVTSGLNSFPAIFFDAYSGAHATYALALSTGNTLASGTSLSTPALMPPVDGCLVYSAIGHIGTSSVVGAGMTLLENVNFTSGQCMGGGTAHEIQTTATSRDADWSWTGTGEAATNILVFFSDTAADPNVIPVGSMTPVAGDNLTSGSWSLPSGWAAGDMAIFWWYTRDSSKTLTPPGTVTTKRDATGASSHRLFIGYRWLVGGDTTFAWTSSSVAGSTVLYGCDVFRQVGTGSGDPFGAESGAPAEQSPPFDPPAVTPPANNAGIWTIGAVNNNSNSSQIGAPDHYAIGEWVSSSDGNDASAATAYRLLTGGSGVSQDPEPYWSYLGSSVGDAGLFWTAALTAAALTITGSGVFGVNTTVKATRAVAFGLDGETNIHDEAGKLKVFGDFEVTGDVTLPRLGGPFVGAQAPGSFTIEDGQYGLHGKRLTLTTTQRGTIEGTGRLVISG